jgi:hypothetical protein
MMTSTNYELIGLQNDILKGDVSVAFSREDSLPDYFEHIRFTFHQALKTLSQSGIEGETCSFHLPSTPGPDLSSAVNRWNETTIGGTCTFHPQSRLGKGFSALGGRWNVAIKSSRGSRNWKSENRPTNRRESIYLLKKSSRSVQ